MGWPDAYDAIVEATLERVPTVIDAVRAELPAGFPAAVSEPIFDGMRTTAARGT